MFDGDELLSLYTALSQVRDGLDYASAALQRVALRLAKDEDRIARLELFYDRVHDNDPALSTTIKEEFGWREV